MALDHEHGELIEGMDYVYTIAPAQKYAELTNLVITLEEETGGKFKRKKPVTRPIFEHAMRYAARAFRNSGISPGSDIDILVQEYPRTNMVCFVFCVEDEDEDLLVPVPVLLGEQMIADLVSRGLWQPYRAN